MAVNFQSFDPWKAVSSGNAYAQAVVDKQRSLQAGQQYAGGDTEGASRTLALGGDIQGAQAIRSGAQQRTEHDQDRQAALFDRQHKYMLDAVPVLDAAYRKDGPQGLASAIDQITPDLQQIGTPPDKIAQLRNSLATNPEQALQALHGAVQLNYQRVGTDLVGLDKTGKEVTRIKGERTAPAGYENAPTGGGLQPIAGGPADPVVLKRNAQDRRTVIVNNPVPTAVAPVTGVGEDDVIKSHVVNILNGNESMSQVPKQYRDRVSVALTKEPQGSYSPISSARLSNAASRITQTYKKLPQYELTANGLPYLQRIDAAIRTPGSVSDQDLLDSLTKLNTAGNAVTEAQVNLILKGQSWSDWLNTAVGRFRNGGVLSPNQRQQIQEISKAIYANYKKGYQPVYEEASKKLRDAGIPEAFWGLPDLNKLSDQATANDAAPASDIDALVNKWLR